MTKNPSAPLISVVIPVFNAEEYLAETITTVINQTYQNWELILVNDRSTDNSKDVAKPFLKDKRIHWVDLPKNSGNGAAPRNEGVALAKGRYVAFLDADDLWANRKLEKQLKFMQQNDCSFSFTSYEFTDAKGRPNGKKAIAPTRLTYKQALKNTTIFTSTVMLDLSKLSKADIKMPNVPSEDTATWWQILKKVPAGYGMPEIYSYYRRSENTLSSNKFKAIQRIWNLYRNVEKINPIKSSYYFCFYAINAFRRRV